MVTTTADGDTATAYCKDDAVAISGGGSVVGGSITASAADARDGETPRGWTVTGSGETKGVTVQVICSVVKA